MAVKVDGKEVNGSRVSFEPLEEPWTKCRLPDGTVIRLKLVVADIIRLDKNDKGESHYLVKSSNIMAVEEPEVAGEVH